VRATAETIRYVAGFVSANFRSREAIAAAGADPNVVARIREAAQLVENFTPILYEFRQSRFAEMV
jgi:hypothetical protein